MDIERFQETDLWLICGHNDQKDYSFYRSSNYALKAEKYPDYHFLIISYFVIFHNFSSEQNLFLLSRHYEIMNGTRKIMFLHINKRKYKSNFFIYWDLFQT